MFINIIMGWLFPWMIAWFFLRKDVSVIYRIGPISSMIAFAFNEIGYHMKWWSVTPTGAGIISFIPYNLGIFPVISCLLIYVRKKASLNSMFLIFIFSIIKTLMESWLVLVDKVNYGNGWNLIWTFVSYILACSLSYVWYQIPFPKNEA